LIRSPNRSIAWIVSLLLAAAPALARPPSEETLKSKAHFKQGQAFYDSGQFAKAVDEYLAAYQLTPLPPLLFNIAQAYRMSEQWEKAAEYYRRYLEAAPDAAPSDEARRHVAEIAKRLDAARAATPPQPPPPAEAPPPPKPAELDEATRAMIRRQVLLEKEAVKAEEERVKEQQRVQREQQERAGRDRSAPILLGLGVTFTVAGVVLISVAAALPQGASSTSSMSTTNSWPNIAEGIVGGMVGLAGVGLLIPGAIFYAAKRKRAGR
jgi:tetratricopeptide (TPR) repeat protein